MPGPARPVYAIVLAAGRGGRFGEDKLLAPLGARPLVAHALDAVQAARRAGVVAAGCVVVREAEGPVAALARAAGLEPVANPDPAGGLAASLRRGMEWGERAHPSGGRAAAVVFLGDQPGTPPGVVAALVAAWEAGGSDPAGARFVRPRYAESAAEPGHPVLLDRALWPLAAELEGDAGFAPLLRARGIEPTLVEVPGRNPDVDRPADLKHVEGSR